MTGFNSKRSAAQAKLDDDDDTLTIVYQRGFADGKRSEQRPWVGLTDEEIFRADPRIGTSDSNVNPYQILINARAIEAKLKEKNHD